MNSDQNSSKNQICKTLYNKKWHQIINQNEASIRVVPESKSNRNINLNFKNNRYHSDERSNTKTSIPLKLRGNKGSPHSS